MVRLNLLIIWLFFNREIFPFPHAFFKRVKLSAKHIQIVKDRLSKC